MSFPHRVLLQVMSARNTRHGGMDSSNDMAWHRKSTIGPGLPELQVSRPTGIWLRPSSTLPNAETAEAHMVRRNRPYPCRKSLLRTRTVTAER
jgi:hypothetical protein